MTPYRFLLKYVTNANAIYIKTGVPSLVTLAQAALESGWGEKAPGYNFFGYTAPAGYSGKKMLLTTIEYHTTPNVKNYPKILKVTKIANGKYKYVVKRYFKAYPSATYSFADYAGLITGAERYADAFNYKHDPEKFFAEIFKAGYATSPEYYKLVISIMNTMKKYLK